MRRKTYDIKDLPLAVQAVKDGMSLRKAEEEFSIPKSTIKDNLEKEQLKPIGRPPVLTDVEEKMLLEYVDLLATWGFPMDGEDIRHFVKSYLDKKGVQTRFDDNLPTYQWLKPFLARHKEFSFRKTTPIKRARARVSRKEVKQFFDHFQKAVDGVPPENIYNYDETCFSDNPKIKKCLFKKGTKHCEKVSNTSKQAAKIKLVPCSQKLQKSNLFITVLLFKILISHLLNFLNKI